MPSKAILKTPFELRTGRRPSLKHLHVWGCAAKAKVHNLNKKKLNSRTVSNFFIGCLERSKGYRFYCPSYDLKIAETSHAKFLEDGESTGSTENRNIVFEEVQDSILIPLDTDNLSCQFSTHVDPDVVVPKTQECMSP